MTAVKRKNDGLEVLGAIQESLKEILKNNIKPKVVHLDTYSYYLLKEYLFEIGVATGNKYFEVYTIKVEYATDEYELVICLDGRSQLPQDTCKKPEIIEVYGC